MTDRLLDRYTRGGSSSPGFQEGGAAEAESIGCFGWLRGQRDRALMLELRKKDGHAMAIAYSWLERVEFDPDRGITLYLPSQTIRITGSGLNAEVRPAVRLFDGIVRHRVSWIRESERAAALQASAESVVVQAIDWDA